MADNDLTELAMRCETATGADVDLNAAILTAIGWRVADDRDLIDPDGNVRLEVPFVVASIDAAMTLVEAGPRRVEFGTYDGGSAWAYVHTPTDIVGESEGAASEAAAICAAALRARVKRIEDKGVV